LLNKITLTPFERKYHIVSVTFLIFVNACENLIMADDVTMPSNPSISLVEKEELEKALFDVNVSQRSREEELSRRVVHTRVDHSAWDHQLFPTTMFVFIIKLGFPVMSIIVGYKAQSNPFPWSIEPNTSFTPFVAFYSFWNCDLSPLSCLLSCNSPKATQVKMLIPM
jgi:hypothetical protein